MILSKKTYYSEESVGNENINEKESYDRANA